MANVLKTDYVEKLINEQIKERQLKADAPLYSESQLMEICGTSRITVRRALKRMIGKGLVYSVKGKGYFVSGMAAKGEGPSLALFKQIEYISPIGASAIGAGKFEGALQVLVGMEAELVRHGYRTALASTLGKISEERRRIEEASKWNSRGIVIEPVYNSTNESLAIAAEMLKRSRMPYVMLSRYVADPDAFNVYEDCFKGSYLATKHLLELGHRSILHINFACGYFDSRRRGYKKALIDFGVKPDPALDYSGPAAVENDVYVVNYEELGRRAIAELYGKVPFTAIVAVNDFTAVAAIRELAERGAKAPDDVSVVGYDDHACAAEFGLSTLKRPFAQIAIAAARSILSQIEPGFACDQELKTGIAPSLERRASSAQVKSQAL